MDESQATPTTLAEYMDGCQPVGFRTDVSYFHDGDFLTFFLANDVHYAERMDDFLTVYKSEESGEVIGCKVKGIRRLVTQMGDLSLTVQVGTVKMGPLLLTAALVSHEDNRNVYLDLAKRMAETEADLSDLPQAA